MNNKKAISTSQLKPQEQIFTKWRKIGYEHWANPGQRSYISPTCPYYSSHPALSMVTDSWHEGCLGHTGFLLFQSSDKAAVAKWQFQSKHSPYSQQAHFANHSSYHRLAHAILQTHFQPNCHCLGLPIPFRRRIRKPYTHLHRRFKNYI